MCYTAGCDPGERGSTGVIRAPGGDGAAGDWILEKRGGFSHRLRPKYDFSVELHRIWGEIREKSPKNRTLGAICAKKALFSPNRCRFAKMPLAAMGFRLDRNNYSTVSPARVTAEAAGHAGLILARFSAASPSSKSSRSPGNPLDFKTQKEPVTTVFLCSRCDRLYKNQSR